MALKVEIDENQPKEINERSGNKNGRDWNIRTQGIWLLSTKFQISNTNRLYASRGNKGLFFCVNII